MALRSTENPSIFEDGRLKAGTYKIQNLLSKTYLDIHHHSMQLCCRPAKDLEEGRGLWEIKRFCAGYTVRRVEQGRPEQYCSPAEGVGHGTPLYVSSYPVAWRVELMKDDIHRGYEYVRFYWGPKKTRAWDLHRGQKENGTAVHMIDELPDHWQTWRLIPVDAGPTSTPSQSQSGMLSLGPLPQDEAPALAPPYDGTQRCVDCSHRSVETGDDGFGTTVTEVTVTTTTTRRKYRVEE